MAKKKKRRQPNRSGPPVTLSPERVFDQAQQALDDGKFRDALTHFKALLKRGDRSEWRAGLAVAYLGRAGELAAKGMHKEALAIGEVRRELCPEAPPDPRHVVLLLRAGRVGDAMAAYRSAEKTLKPAELALLNAEFAALHLGSDDLGLGTALDAQHPIIAHGVAARFALEAWCRGDDESAAQAVAGIPFRSPYRDWVSIIKALLKHQQQPAAATQQLARVAPDSPFAGVVDAVRIALLPDAELQQALVAAGETTQRFATALRGWSEARLALWRELQALGSVPRANDLLKLMWRHRKALGEAWIRRQSLPLLTAEFPRSLKRSPLVGSARPNDLDKFLIAAWYEEADGFSEAVFDAWQDVIDHLYHRSQPAPGSDDALRIALIQRRLDSRWNMLSYPQGPYDESNLAGEALRYLHQSIHLDPDYQPTYTRLIALYRDKRDLKQARPILEQALARWPDDPPVLIEALETAVSGGAFKKAAGFARRILALDPINSTAKASLLVAHMAHARKQLRKGRIDLALKELQAAEEWAQGVRAEGRLAVLRGFVTLDEDPKTGAALLREAIDALGAGLSAQLTLALEAERLDRRLGPLVNRIGLTKVKQPGIDDLLEFLCGLREALDAGHTLTSATRAYFEPALKRAAGLALTRGDAEGACETLRRGALDGARLAHARAAAKRWPDAPVFELHAFEARFRGHRSQVKKADLQRLEKALARAKETGEMRVALRLGELLDEYALMPNFADPFGRGDEFDPFDPVDPPPPGARALFDEVGMEGMLDMLDRSAEGGAELRSLQQQLSPEHFRAVFEAILSGAPMEVVMDIIHSAPPPSKAAPRGRKPKARKAVTGKPSPPNAAPGSDDNTDPDDECRAPVQLDLFK